MAAHDSLTKPFSGRGARHQYAAHRVLATVSAAVAAIGLLYASSAPAVAAGTATTSDSSNAVCGAPTVGRVTCLARIPKTPSPNGPFARVRAAGVSSRVVGPGYDASDIESAYSLSSTAGLNTTVAVVDPFDFSTAPSDLATWRTQNSLPALATSPCGTSVPCFTEENQNGVVLTGPSDPNSAPTPATPNDQGWGVEEMLDLDAVSAACPNCNITLVEADTTIDSDIYPAIDAAANSGAVAVSTSFGEDEASSNPSLNAHFNKSNVAFTTAGGDDGYHVGSGYPTSSPDVISVGGTSLTKSGSNWLQSAWSGTGSGCSEFEAKPAWQTDTGCAHRTTDDVSADADPDTGLNIYYSGPAGDSGFPGPSNEVGGTSLSSPLMAGMIAASGGAGSVVGAKGFYGMPAADLTDVTSGSDLDGGSDIGFDGTTCAGATLYLCTARVGYDGPTGVGAPRLAPPPYVATTASATPTLTFGTAVEYGAPSAAQTATFTNTGTFAINVTGAFVGGAAASSYSVTSTTCTGAHLAGSASCSVSVKLTPLASGTLDANITFASDAANGPQTTTLSGTGTPPPFAEFDDSQSNGATHATAGTPALANAPGLPNELGRDIAVNNTGGGYELDGWGGIHPLGNAPKVSGSPYWKGWDIARAIVLRSDGVSGYVLDGYGGVHPFGSAGHVAPPVHMSAYWSGWDIANDLVLRPDGQSGYVLDGWGNLHGFGVTGDIPSAPAVSAYWKGWDIARRVAIDPDGAGGQVLDGYGGLHRWGNAAAVTGFTYWGWDIARDVVLLPGSTTSGYTLDGYGGIHPFGPSAGPVTSPGYIAGRDLFRALSMA